LLYHFYTINPLTCFWTVLVFPLIALILCFGYLQILLTLIFPSVSSLLMFLLNGLVEILIWSVKLLSEMFPSEILIGKVSPGFVIFFYAALLIIVWFVFSRIRMKKLVISFLVLLIIVSLGFIKGQKLKQNELVMTVLDVGHGQAIVLQSQGRCIVFDAGSLNRKNIGSRIVVPFLRYRGISAIDAVIISHKDIDHMNGLPEITEQYQVKKVCASKDFTMKKEKGIAGFLSKALKLNGLNIDAINDNKLNRSIDFEMLWPADEVCGDNSLSENDKSIVALVTFADRKILITSDIEEIAQDKLIEQYENLSADVVIVPHHGSQSSFESGFLERLNAQYLICSCSRTRLENLQNKKIPGNADLFITARDGAVSIMINQKGKLSVETFFY